MNDRTRRNACGELVSSRWLYFQVQLILRCCPLVVISCRASHYLQFLQAPFELSIDDRWLHLQCRTTPLRCGLPTCADEPLVVRSHMYHRRLGHYCPRPSRPRRFAIRRIFVTLPPWHDACPPATSALFPFLDSRGVLALTTLEWRRRIGRKTRVCVDCPRLPLSAHVAAAQDIDRILHPTLQVFDDRLASDRRERWAMADFRAITADR
ncbi:hypothetical protein B0H13DRAFT_2008021, partial [Mycena leptocephala]